MRFSDLDTFAESLARAMYARQEHKSVKVSGALPALRDMKHIVIVRKERQMSSLNTTRAGQVGMPGLPSAKLRR